MMIFLILSGFIAAILYRQIQTAFLANPGLNGLIVGVLAVGVLLVFTHVLRLFPRSALGQFLPPRVTRRRSGATRCCWRRCGR
jgi:hypothetical protein